MKQDLQSAAIRLSKELLQAEAKGLDLSKFPRLEIAWQYLTAAIMKGERTCEP